MTTNPPASDREALSALFDGELIGDAARFALKRLDHDHDWRATCERWQRVGDVLRSRDTTLPAYSPSRIRAAMHAEAVPARTRAGGFRWGSVALAASAAVVAFFLARMPIGGTETASTEQLAIDNGTSQPAASASTMRAASAEGVDTVAVAALSRPAQRDRRLQRDRAATDRVISSMVADAQISGEASAASIARPVADDTALRADTVAEHMASATATPFDSIATDAPARPWPRAVLPQYGSGGTLVADHATVPSFYPFAPATQDTTPSDDAQHAAAPNETELP